MYVSMSTALETKIAAYASPVDQDWQLILARVQKHMGTFEEENRVLTEQLLKINNEKKKLSVQEEEGIVVMSTCHNVFESSTHI